MKLCKTVFMLIFVFANFLAFGQKANHLVIAEVYGGGGNSTSYYQYDYIILYNPTSSAVNLNGWSVQYASSSGTSWDTTNLSGSIAAGDYYAIQEHQGSHGTAGLPFTPDAIGTISMASSSGKVALVNNITKMSSSDPQTDANSAALVDFVGFGSANAYEGTGAAPSPSNTKSIRRLDNSGNQNNSTNGSGWDSNDNSNDFFTYDLTSSNPPLPVELKAFAAKVSSNQVDLKWSTSTEVNNYGFNIQRAEAGNQGSNYEWKKIGFVRGSGNSNSTKSYSFNDANISSGKYVYRLKQIDNNGKFKYSNSIEVNISEIPNNYALGQNYPNPFNPTTIINYQIPKRGFVTLKLFDALGREVSTLVNENKAAGKYSVTLNGSRLSSGVYIYKLSSGSFISTKKLVLMK